MLWKVTADVLRCSWARSLPLLNKKVEMRPSPVQSHGLKETVNIIYVPRDEKKKTFLPKGFQEHGRKQEIFVKRTLLDSRRITLMDPQLFLRQA